VGTTRGDADELQLARINLVIANRAMAQTGAVDAYGHVSMRHPTDPRKFLLSQSRSPELIEIDDVMQFNLDGSVVGADNRPPYLERFLHAAVYEARPDVHAVAHGHAASVIPFSLTDTPLVPVFLGASDCGAHIPVWDIRDNFGDTDMLIRNMAQGHDLARGLGPNRVVLMRGHGFVSAGRSLPHLLNVSQYLIMNAKILLDALRLGPVKQLTPGEMHLRDQTMGDDNAPAVLRGWEYAAVKAGCADLFKRSVELRKKLQTEKASTTP
jgi:ribulose-5-phosphate 4-epimerase/fuculose-1-phosphate aldolase